MQVRLLLRSLRFAGKALRVQQGQDEFSRHELSQSCSFMCVPGMSVVMPFVRISYDSFPCFLTAVEARVMICRYFYPVAAMTGLGAIIAASSGNTAETGGVPAAGGVNIIALNRLP